MIVNVLLLAAWTLGKQRMYRRFIKIMAAERLPSYLNISTSLPGNIRRSGGFIMIYRCHSFLFADV
jgi:hypothetical protein